MIGTEAVTSVVLAAITDPVPPPGADSFRLLVGWTAWGVTICALIGLLIVAGTMAVQHRRGGISEHGAALGAVITACVIAASAGPIVAALGLG